MEWPGRDSISWEINGERLSVLAWPRAILLQFAHPLIAAAVAEHSSFQRGALAPFARLHATIGAMRAIAFGPPEARARTIERIRGIHRRVNGVLREDAGRFPAGTRYSAEDPELLLWVHATLLDSLPRLHSQIVRPLGRAEFDAVCAESAGLAEALGVHAARVPRSQSQLESYADATMRSGTIAVSRAARELAVRVLRPPFQPILFPATRIQRLLTIASLPDAVRAQYGLTWSPRETRAARRWLALLRRIRGNMPHRLARWPEAR